MSSSGSEKKVKFGEVESSFDDERDDLGEYIVIDLEIEPNAFEKLLFGPSGSQSEYESSDDVNAPKIMEIPCETSNSFQYKEDVNKGFYNPSLKREHDYFNDKQDKVTLVPIQVDSEKMTRCASWLMQDIIENSINSLLSENGTIMDSSDNEKIKASVRGAEKKEVRKRVSFVENDSTDFGVSDLKSEANDSEQNEKICKYGFVPKIISYSYSGFSYISEEKPDPLINSVFTGAYLHSYSYSESGDQATKGFVHSMTQKHGFPIRQA
ncbi:hypothetical protein Ciccas_003391 [Cichlidogyrus casuarinus]|uniref:Uncharacterized protein n=1 Tax=Cichlidogyrus casuarinus TaxID=1844966 RepID=A0ABD2QGS9_9PLAT